MVEQEMKLQIKNISAILIRLRTIGKFIRTEYILDSITRTAAELGFSGHQAIKKKADELYLDWSRANNLTELRHICFGLPPDPQRTNPILEK